MGGGPVEVIRQFSAAHQEQGHQVETLTLDSPQNEYLRDLPGVVHGIGAHSNGYGYTPALIPWLRERSQSFDAIFVHGLWQFHGRGTRNALQGAPTPYFVYPHGMLDPWFRSAYPIKHLKKAIYWRLIENRVLRDATAVLFTCEEERLLAKQTFSPYRCIEKVAPLGISAPSGAAEMQREAFLRRYPELRGKRFLLFLGRLHHKKGCDMLIRAFGELQRQCIIDPDQMLVLAGPCAEPAYLDSLRRLASNLCSTSSVCFPGMLTGEVKWGALRGAEVFVLPSHQENFGIAVVEALACAVPVLISNKVNIWREIEADSAGFVEADSVEGTYRMLSKWSAATPQHQSAMRENAQCLFERRFEIQETARNLIRVIREARE
ncbi:glycosyltransferase [Verrucomicrobiota bacterium sgz303538]